MQRLVDWNVEVLSGLLRKIIARREALAKQTKALSTADIKSSSGKYSMVLDEAKDVISLPEFNGDAIKKQVDPDSVRLDPAVVEEMRRLVAKIAEGYRENPFHNFEHAR